MPKFPDDMDAARALTARNLKARKEAAKLVKKGRLATQAELLKMRQKVADEMGVPIEEVTVAFACNRGR